MQILERDCFLIAAHFDWTQMQENGRALVAAARARRRS